MGVLATVIMFVVMHLLFPARGLAFQLAGLFALFLSIKLALLLFFCAFVLDAAYACSNKNEKNEA